MNQKHNKRIAPHQSPEVQAMSDSEIWDHYQELQFTLFDDVPLQSPPPPETPVIIGMPLFSHGAGHCSAAYNSWAISFVSERDLVDFLSVLHVGTIAPLSKRPQLELIEEVHALVESRRAEHSGAPPLQALIQEVNSKLDDLLELKLMSYQEYLDADEDPDWICAHFRSCWSH